MYFTRSVHLTFLIVMLSFGRLWAQDAANNHIGWSVPATLPPPEGATLQPGMAGASAGVHNDVLLIAGGANFPDGMPWEGGQKKHHNDVYVLQRDSQWLPPVKL